MDFKIEEVELYSGKAVAPPNEYVEELQKLVAQQNPKASIGFPNDPHQKGFKYAAGKLREKGVFFTFRKETGDKKETHSRVWWLKEAPVRKAREAKKKNEQKPTAEGE